MALLGLAGSSMGKTHFVVGVTHQPSYRSTTERTCGSAIENEGHTRAQLSHQNLYSRDRSRVCGNCSTTTARFLRVAVTTYFYKHEKSV
eukprot:scaffold80030_cov57-Phaeocystis_antarctica.AAC.1